MKTLFLSVVCLLMLMQPSFAQEERFPQMEACLEKAGGVHFEMLTCARDEYQRQDARLNAAYKKATTDISPVRQNQLLEAQRAWVKYRDAYALFLYDPDGGQIAQLDSNTWMVTATASRANELENSQ